MHSSTLGPWGEPRKDAYVVASMVLSVFTNAAVIVSVARSVSVEAFGQFSLAYGIVALTIELARATAGEMSFLVAGSKRDGPLTWETLYAVALLSLPISAIGVILSHDGGAWWVVPVVAPIVATHEVLRQHLFAVGEHKVACVLDTVWAFIALGMVGATFVWSFTESHLVLMWCLGSIVSIFSVGANRIGAPRGPTAARVRLANAWGSLRTLGWEFVGNRGFGYALMYLAAPVVGVSGIGVYRASQLLLSPHRIWLMALRARLLPRAMASRTQEGLYETSRWFLRFAILGLLVLPAYLVIPTAIGRIVLGEMWSEARTVALLQVGVLLGASVHAAFHLRLRAYRALKPTARTQWVVGSTSLALGLAGGALAGVRGLAAALSFSGLFSIAIWRWITTRAERGALARQGAPDVVQREDASK